MPGALCEAAGGRMLHAGTQLQWPVGIRHHRETSSRLGYSNAAKSLEETMDEIAKAVCRLCLGGSWKKRYEAGLRRLRIGWVSPRGGNFARSSPGST
jgi:hypothetical protein